MTRLLGVAILPALVLTDFSGGPPIPKGPAPVRDASRAPAHVVYYLFLREVVAFQNRADDLERQGRSGVYFRNEHQQVTELSDRQFGVVQKVAAFCARDVQPYDNEAAHIIESVRNSIQAAGPGARVPPVPQELIALEQKRNARVLAAMEEIRTALGPGAFLYFDMLVRRHLNPELRYPERAPVPPDRDPSSTPKQTGARPELGGELYFATTIYWDEPNHVVTGYGGTIVNYATAYYYRAAVEVTLTKDGRQVASGAGQNPFGNAEVWVDFEQVPGARYDVKSHHRLDAMYKYGQTVEECAPRCSWWDDHYGFSRETAK